MENIDIKKILGKSEHKAAIPQLEKIIKTADDVANLPMLTSIPGVYVIQEFIQTALATPAVEVKE